MMGRLLEAMPQPLLSWCLWHCLVRPEPAHWGSESFVVFDARCFCLRLSVVRGHLEDEVEGRWLHGSEKGERLRQVSRAELIGSRRTCWIRGPLIFFYAAPLPAPPEQNRELSRGMWSKRHRDIAAVSALWPVGKGKPCIILRIRSD